MKPPTQKQRGTALERSVENYLGWEGWGLKQFYSREASPLTLMQLQITNICSVRIGVLYFICEKSQCNIYNHRHCDEKKKKKKKKKKKTREEKRTAQGSMAILIQNTRNITKTCLYNFDRLKPHFYTLKLGFIGVYINFLISAQKHRLWVLVRTASSRRF